MNIPVCTSFLCLIASLLGSLIAALHCQAPWWMVILTTICGMMLGILTALGSGKLGFLMHRDGARIRHEGLRITGTLVLFIVAFPATLALSISCFIWILARLGYAPMG